MAFDLVLADPPWRYSFSSTKARKIENQYPTMSPDEIKDLGPKLPIAEDAVLFLWATAPKLPLALEVMEAWGFVYKTNAVWDKVLFGMGYWFRGQHEHLLVGTRGRFPPPAAEHRRGSIFEEKRTRHSKKPSCVHEWIELAFPSAKKIELFARERRPGWAVWGNDVVSTIALLAEEEEVMDGTDDATLDNVTNGTPALCPCGSGMQAAYCGCPTTAGRPIEPMKGEEGLILFTVPPKSGKMLEVTEVAVGADAAAEPVATVDPFAGLPVVRKVIVNGVEQDKPVAERADKVADFVDWRTPQPLLDRVRDYFGGPIPLDPAAEPTNWTRAERFFTPEEDGLARTWDAWGVFVNPPYGKFIRAWTGKIAEEAAKGTAIIALLPCGARFSTKYWQHDILNGTLTCACFVRGRVPFVGPDGKPVKANTYDSMLYGFNADLAQFARAFKTLGKCFSMKELT